MNQTLQLKSVIFFSQMILWLTVADILQIHVQAVHKEMALFGVMEIVNGLMKHVF